MDYAYNEQADQMLNKAMDDLQRQLDRAESTFESDGSMLEIKSRYANCNDMCVLGDIMSESRRITDELYASYESLIRAANSICKPLVDEGVRPKSIKRVVKFMEHINSECSTLGSNYSVSINSYSYGNVASTRYSPTSEARMIESNWKLLYNMHPMVAEEKRLEEEARAKARAEREERERLEREKYAAEYPQKLAEWEAECAKVEKERAELIAEAEKRAERELRNRYTRERDDVIKPAQEAVEAQRRIIERAEHTIETAKFLEFGKKIAANNEKTNAIAVMGRAHDLIYEAQTKYDSNMAQFASELEKECRKARERVERENPLPRKPRDPNSKDPFAVSSGATAVQIANAGVKQAIYETLCDYGTCMNITDIMQNCPEVADLSNQRVSALVRQLVSDGLVERIEEKRMAFFRAVE